MADAEKGPEKPGGKAGQAPPGAHSIEDVLKLTQELCKDGEGGHVADAVSAALFAVLGSGPTVATLQSLIAANQASGAMYQNAVANQQMTNILGMVATMNCVQVLLDKEPNIPWPDVTWRSGESS